MLWTHASNLTPKLCADITNTARWVNDYLSAFSRQEHNAHMSPYAIEKIEGTIKTLELLLDRIRSEVEA